jgi:transposase InsO family protein
MKKIADEAAESAWRSGMAEITQTKEGASVPSSKPGDLEAQIEAFVADYNHRRYHESIGNLMLADVYFGRGQTILIERERIKRQTIVNRRLMHRRQAA